MKSKLQHYYTKLTEKYPSFLWPRVHGRIMKDVGHMDLKITQPLLIAEPKHKIKALQKPIFPLKGIPRNII